MERALKALGLVKHVRRQLGIADKVPADEFLPLLDKIIRTQAKAYAVHGLPFYIYIWALLNAEKGDSEAAKRLYALFLSQQEAFKSSKVDEWIIQYIKIEGWYDVEEAIEEAREFLSR
jgi:hypothetical protein